MVMVVQLSNKIIHPTLILIAENSGSWKSCLDANIFLNYTIESELQETDWFYRQYQDLYLVFSKEGHKIQFIEGLLEEISKAENFEKFHHNLCISAAGEQILEDVAQLFFNAGRHGNTLFTLHEI